MLRQLVDRMYFDENRWVLLQVLGIYLANMGRYDQAHGVYLEARERFPYYEIPAEVERLIGTEAAHA